MQKQILLAGCLFVPLAIYACSSDDTEDTTPSSGGGQNQAGGTARGGNSTKVTSGGTAGRNSTDNRGGAGGATGVVGGAPTTSNGGSGITGTSGAGTVAGTAAVGAAGNATVPSGGSTGSNGGTASNVGGRSAGGNSGTGGAAGSKPAGGAAGSKPVGGAGGSSASGVVAGASGQTIGSGGTAGSTFTPPATGGSAGAPAVSCDPLCGGSTCSSQPACLAEAYGIGTGDSMPICVPGSTIPMGSFTVSICTDTMCGGAQGCPMTLHFGTTSWSVGTADGTGTSPAQVDTVLTEITGELAAKIGTNPCTVSLGVPVAGIPATALGKLTPVTGSSLLGLSFQSISVDLATLTADSAVPTCKNLAGTYLTTDPTALTTPLLDAMNARANSMRCLACRGDCPQQMACTAP